MKTWKPRRAQALSREHLPPHQLYCCQEGLCVNALLINQVWAEWPTRSGASRQRAPKHWCKAPVASATFSGAKHRRTARGGRLKERGRVCCSGWNTQSFVTGDGGLEYHLQHQFHKLRLPHLFEGYFVNKCGKTAARYTWPNRLQSSLITNLDIRNNIFSSTQVILRKEQCIRILDCASFFLGSLDCVQSRLDFNTLTHRQAMPFGNVYLTKVNVTQINVLQVNLASIHKT